MRLVPWCFGKGAEILGINKIDLITDLRKLGIPYFHNKYEDILNKAGEE